MTAQDEAAGTTVSRPPDIKAVPVRHPGRWVAVAIIAVIVAMMVHTAVFARVKRGNSLQTRFGWGVVGDYLFARPILQGVLTTLELTAIGMAIGIVGGILLAVMRLSVNPVLSGVSWVYLWFFRGTPLLVQLAFWYSGISYLYPQLSLGVPFGPEVTHFSANNLIVPMVAACIGLGFNEAAYMAEIVRAGILSVEEGQMEAASSLGMNRALTMRRVILPQAMRVIIPPTGNEVISMLKNTSLAYIAAVGELYFAQYIIAARTYQIVPMLLVACIWYLAMTSVLMVGQYYIERHYARGAVRQMPPTPWQKFRGLVRRRPPTPAEIAVDAGADLPTWHGVQGGQH
ncbi:MAG: amino acid ABC transporter permease [Jatrophihabitans sp.]|nr:MAG: amino acid ABC transporter permease [Jatrophihabitans sp.]